jgi:hypothetical protein
MRMDRRAGASCARPGRVKQRADARRPEGVDPIAHDGPRPAQRHHVDELVGERRARVLALAVQVQVLDLTGRLFEAIALHQVVVEVLLARPHPPDVQGEHGAHEVAGGGTVVGDVGLDRGGDVERTGEIISFSALPGPSGRGSSSVSPLYSSRSRASALRTTATYSRVRWSWRAKR